MADAQTIPITGAGAMPAAELHSAMSEDAQLPRATPLAVPTCVQVKFWGTRGSIPVSGAGYEEYGGNTVCVSLTSDSGHLFIFDAGSGIRPLGVALQQQAHAPHGQPAIGYLCLSHSHWDHIQGFPFFKPAFAARAELSIIGCSDRTQTLVNLLAGQQEWSYFPVPLASLPAHLKFYAICGGECRLDGADLATLLQKHTLPSLAFRLKLGGWNFVYATDNEPLSPPTLGDNLLGYDVIDQRLVEFARGADLLVHDSQYTRDEYSQRIGWGHNIPEVAVDTAILAGVKRLALFHHDPEHNDAQLDAMLARAQARARRLADDQLEVFSARDGLELTL